MKFILMVLLGFILMIIAALFSGANDLLLKFDYLVGEGQWYLSHLLLVAFLLGLATALVLVLPGLMQSKARNLQLKQKIKKLESLASKQSSLEQSMKLSSELSNTNKGQF
ncbi:MAG: hypothetical protein COW84_01585 [Gammaproteobacteria bacterium CG22_combo_CG10-13_8_21_14_all_40_8]|nr:MAG: hypothetical protein COW84_01585 [Gammaproteobacteria bacterium CG22_combo_CG10-13_8_21_14_all_40_8]